MIFPHSFPAAGSILGLRKGRGTHWFDGSVSLEREAFGFRAWERLLWLSKEPMAGELAAGAEFFSYPFLFRISKEQDHALLFGHHGGLVEAFLEIALTKARVYCPAIEIQRLVSDLVEHPVQYNMSAIHARIERHAPALRSLSLYGSDVGDTEILRRLLPDLDAYRVNLRSVTTGRELLSVGSRGELSFSYGGRASLEGVDAILGFLAQGKYIDWSRQLVVNLR